MSTDEARRRADRRLPLGLRHEQGDAVPAAPQRVAVVAHWSAVPEVTRSFARLVDGLRAEGYVVVVASAAEFDAPLAWPDALPSGVTVYRRPNLGYDFGSWSSVLRAHEQVRRAPRVLLVNDSLVGPFASIAPLIASFEGAATEVWGAVRSHQFRPHLQSYFVGYRGGRVLARGPIARFWRRIAVQPTKTDVIWQYELGLAGLLERRRIPTAAAWDGVAISGQENPAIVGWRRLLEAGFPFVKRELLTDPAVAPDAAVAPEEIRRRFGEDVREWL